ncbi:hypothetical protein IG197_19850 [Aminobacter sp. SR38]|jgi:hypothetical protein|uniref:hypothetical protein n=1 Tax=unclassified Aminobacter TaxID=2644704 RepID=UPI0012AFEB83|nr:MULTISPECIES: hypothetical protein [unclassified Aminobacter]MRX37068.1 hypothetical protein [Aminobacter sp. MDW-2]QNH35040.1 hypothetical protein H5P29_03660 [Aminobacter sp. MDW-2]QOF70074.1 hypothetical protein IG197_19850 [Aminobacter sp. SR38]
MADSDHSMSFGCVTRRLALGGLFVVSGGWAFGGNALARATAASDIVPDPKDPAMAVWRDWEAAYVRAMWLCDRQQKLEAALAERVDGLWTVVSSPDGEEAIVCSKAALDRIVGDRTDMAAIRAKAEAELDARQAHFEVVATEIGYFEGLRAEQAGFARVAELLEALSGTPANSLAGVVGKLDAVLRNGADWEDRSAFPWPQIRSAREDLMRIGHQLTPHAFFPDGKR